MALIICPECRKEVSDKAVVCPNCGYPISNNEIIMNLDDKNKTSEKLADDDFAEDFNKEIDDNVNCRETINEEIRNKIINDILYNPDKLEQLIGSKGEYYSAEFIKIKEGIKPKFNWATFLIGPIHCLYRRNIGMFLKYYILDLFLYLLTMILAIVGIFGTLLFFILGGIFNGILCGTLAVASGLAASLVIPIIAGKKFNLSYYNLIKKKIFESITPMDNSAEEFLLNHEEIKKKSRKNLVFPIIFAIVIIMVGSGIGILSNVIISSISEEMENTLSEDLFDTDNASDIENSSDEETDDIDEDYDNEDSFETNGDTDSISNDDTESYDTYNPRYNSENELEKYLNHIGYNMNDVVYIEEAECMEDEFYVYYTDFSDYELLVRTHSPYSIFEGVIGGGGVWRVWEDGHEVYDDIEAD